jgi:hypothetical protein
MDDRIKATGHEIAISIFIRSVVDFERLWEYVSFAKWRSSPTTG